MRVYDGKSIRLKERLKLHMTRTRILFVALVLMLSLFGAASAAQATTTPIEAMNILIWEDTENERTTVTVFGFIGVDAPLPAEISFYFVEDYNLNLLDQLPADTTMVTEQNALEYTAQPSGREDFENLTRYSFILTEGHVFVAGFDIGVSLFEFEEAMGGLPIASFTFVPPNDLLELGIGFVSPDFELVGAGSEVVFIGEADEGEIYGIVRRDVPEGELQEVVVAFGTRESRDAALAEAAEESQGANSAVLDWFSTPTGMVMTGSAAVLLLAVAAFIVLMRRNKGAVEDVDLDHDDEHDDEHESTDEGEHKDEDPDLADEEGDFSEEILIVDDEKRQGLHATNTVLDPQAVEFSAPGDDD